MHASPTSTHRSPTSVLRPTPTPTPLEQRCRITSAVPSLTSPRRRSSWRPASRPTRPWSIEWSPRRSVQGWWHDELAVDRSLRRRGDAAPGQRRHHHPLADLAGTVGADLRRFGLADRLLHAVQVRLAGTE